jgi:chromosome segregation ATPase
LKREQEEILSSPWKKIQVSSLSLKGEVLDRLKCLGEELPDIIKANQNIQRLAEFLNELKIEDEAANLSLLSQSVEQLKDINLQCQDQFRLLKSKLIELEKGRDLISRNLERIDCETDDIKRSFQARKAKCEEREADIYRFYKYSFS